MFAPAQVLTHGQVEVAWSAYPAFHHAVLDCSFAARCLAEVLDEAITLEDLGTDRCDVPHGRTEPSRRFGARVTYRSALLWSPERSDTLVLDWVVLGRDQASATLCRIAAGDVRRGADAHGRAALRFFEPGRGWEDRDPVSGGVLRR